MTIISIYLEFLYLTEKNPDKCAYKMCLINIYTHLHYCRLGVTV